MPVPMARTQPPRGLLRWFNRFPIWIYRLGLGSLFGRRMLLLEHKGRKTGNTRQAVLEVVDHDPQSGSWIVASGWGEKANWFRNVMQTPEVLLEVAGSRFPAVARRLPLDEAAAALRGYAHRHPTAFRQLSRLMVGRQVEDTQEDYHRLAELVPLVEFRSIESKELKA